MDLSARKHDILRLVRDRGPFSNDGIAKEVVGDQHASSADVESAIAELELDGLIEESAAFPGRWQITDEGQKQAVS